MQIPVQTQFKKLTAAGAAMSHSGRLRIRDNNGTTFLIDSGADLSLIPKKPSDTSSPTGYVLYAANGSEIQTYGTKRITTCLGLRRNFTWEFLVADITEAIIGCDFLSHYDLLIDVSNQTIIDRVTTIQKRGTTTNSGPAISIVARPTSHSIVQHLSQKYPRVFAPTNKDPSQTPASSKHFIETTGPPVSCRPRRLNGDKYKAAKDHFNDLVTRGICRRSSSNWSSPIHLVEKNKTEWRVCGDFRAVNARTVPDSYCVAHLKSFQTILEGATIFSKLDLLNAFHQIPVEESSIPKTAVTTPFGLFEYLFMPYGLRNAAQTQQRFMDEIFRQLPHTFCYVDDILIASTDEETHKKHLDEVFRLLDQHQLAINVKKCVFAEPAIDYLGHRITPQGISPLEEKVKEIIEYPKPPNIASLKRFIGMANFYRRFLPGAASYLKELDAAAVTKKKNDTSPVKWTPAAEEAFERTKREIAETTLLAHPSSAASLALHVDASDTAVGAALHQATENGYQPLGFFSKRLSETKQRYSTYDRELEAIFQGIRHFQEDIEGRELIIFTDHKPLTFAMNKSAKVTNQRQARQLDFISQYTTDIRHIPGDENSVADALSRIASISQTAAVDEQQLAEEQERDDELRDILQDKKKSSLQLKRITNSFGVTLTGDQHNGRWRPFVPAPLRNRIIAQLHNVNHPGIRATTKLVTDNFIWPNVHRDCKQFVRTCIQCQKSKIHQHTKAPLVTPIPPNGRFQHLNVDIIGPYPPSQGYRFCLTIIDRYTRWPAAVPMSDSTATSVARALLDGWIQHFGVPTRITTDQGRVFESHLFAELNQMLGTRHLKTTAYRPQANGIIERWHRTLKAAIKCHTETNWSSIIPLVVLGLRCTWKEDLEMTPAELVYGQTLQLPGAYFGDYSSNDPPTTDFVKELQSFFKIIRPQPTAHHAKNTVYVPKDLRTTKYVFLRNDAVLRPFQRPYNGPFKVKSRTDKTFTIIQDGKEKKVGIDRLKPAFLTMEGNAEEQQSGAPTTTTKTTELSTDQTKMSNPNRTESRKTVRFTLRNGKTLLY